MIRPGPPSIDPGRSPGGVVVQVYDTAGVLLSSSHLTPDDRADRAAVQRVAELDRHQVDALRRDDGPIVIVAYDGDTGHRLTTTEWLAWLLT